MTDSLLVLFILMKSLLPWEIAGGKALKEVNWCWRPAGWTIEFQPEKKSFLGIRDLHSKTIIIWVRPNHSSKKVASVITHEFAHIFSELYLTDELRQEWLKARGLPLTTVWFPKADWESDYTYGEGDFAESVAWTLQKGSFNGKLKPAPNRKQQELIQRWLATLPDK